MAASVVYLSNVDVDRPLSKAAWNNSQALRHFSILRKLDGAPFPAGAPPNPSLKRASTAEMVTLCLLQYKEPLAIQLHH